MKAMFAPIPFAAAVLLAASPFIGSVGATAANKPVATAASVPTKGATQGTVHKIAMKTGMAGGKMVFLDEKGAPNPVLRGKVGDTMEITIASGEGAEHDIVFPDLGVKSRNFDAKSGPVKVTFKLTQSGMFV